MVFVLDEASRRIRPVKYILFTIAVSASYTSVLIVYLLNLDDPLSFSILPMFLYCWGLTAVVMYFAYRDRSDPQGATLFNKAGMTKATVALTIAVILLGIVENASRIPADFASRTIWIQDNLNLPTYLAGLMNMAMMSGLLAMGVVATWLGERLRGRFRG